MITSMIETAGPWSWWVIGLVLLILELLVPGVFLIWIGIAAIITGALSLVFWGAAFWVWEVQLLIFAALALVSILVGRRLMSGSRKDSDQPELNERMATLVGRTAVLMEGISNGRGRIKLDDTTWSVKGPELPEGTRVRIISGDGNTLTVEPV